MPSDRFHQQIAGLKQRVDDALKQTLARCQWPPALLDAVQYSLCSGGKRLRPCLVLLATEVCDGDPEKAMSAACAIEMVHTYSLIHDDLPSMDNDDLRRGRPTSHRVFGEALAILAGDALLTLAFETVSGADLPASVTVECVQILSSAAGGSGMVGGQVLDLEAERGPFTASTIRLAGNSAAPLQSSTAENLHPGNSKRPNVRSNHSPIDEKGRSDTARTADEKRAGLTDSGNDPSGHKDLHVEDLVQIHKMKTGALITAALELGAAVAEANPDQRTALRQYGQSAGLAFQIADDLLDVTGNNDRIGKETGRDQQLGKLTYPSLIGIDASRSKARALADNALTALCIFDERANSLRELARFIVERDH